MQHLNISFILSISIVALALLLLCSPFIVIGCSSSAEYIPEKMDAPLQQRIRQLENEDPNAIIQFAGKTNPSINEEMIAKLKSTGITTESIIEDIFTASGNAESIKKVSLLDFIVFLEIAKKLDIK
jgi:predicted PurR-regulated permease PerM